jgi:hypothetical protein
VLLTILVLATEGYMAKTVADQFAEILVATGVKRIYGIAGDTLTGPAITVEMAKGFSLYMVKAIMNGRADELIDLAKTNLWR